MPVSRHTTGSPPRGRHWYAWTYLRGVGAILAALVVSFALTFPMRREMVRDVGSVSPEKLVRLVSSMFGFDVQASVSHQFGEFLLTRLTYEPVLLFMVGGAAVTLALWWRGRGSRRSSGRSFRP